jgi:ornithine cyclodeaminase/alanine dehydrogenase
MDAIERAFAALGRGEVGEPVSVGMDLGEGMFHVKACAGSPAHAGILVAKLNANFPANRERHGLPTIQGVVAVFDASNGRLLALVDSPSVTSLRTAATTALAIHWLAPRDAKVATIVGCGALGRAHLEALRGCTAIRKVNLFDRDAGSAQTLAGWACGELGLECAVAAELPKATLASEVIVTCASSKLAYLEAGHVRPGTFVAAVGADNEHKSEIAASLLGAARIVTDRTVQCRKVGDLRNAPEGATVCGEMTDVVAGRVPRTAPGEIVLFDSTGLAVEDLAVCALLL